MRSLMLALLGLSGCSLATFDLEKCSGNSECHVAFGLGSVCQDDGFCDDAPAFARCSQTEPSAVIGTDRMFDDPLIVGTLFARNTGQLLEESSRLAVVQATAAGGLDGRSMVLVQCDYGPRDDDELSRDEAVIQAIQYLDEVLDVRVIVGPASSGAVTMRERNMMLISPSATGPSITDIEGIVASDTSPGRLWRTAPSDTIQGAVIASDVRDQGITGLGLIHANEPYGTGIRDVMVEKLVDIDVTVLSYSAPALLPDLLLDLSEDESIQGIVVASAAISDVVAAVDSAATIDALETRTLFFPDVGASAEVLQAVVDRGIEDSVRGTRPVVPGGRVYQSFEASFAGEYGGRSPADDTFSAYAYDAMWLALYGSAWAHFQGDADQALDVASGLRRVSDGDVVDIRTFNWARVQETFREGQSINVRGASGDLDFDPNTEETTSAIEVWTVRSEEGEPVLVQEYVVQP
jgi:branched-chain amino acid transport system substrate-binding protein